MKKLLSLLVGLIFVNVNAQSKHTYMYRLETKSQPSYCYFRIDTSESLNRTLKIKMIDKSDNPLISGIVKLVLQNNDTINLFTNYDGYVDTSVSSKVYRVIASYVGHSPLNAFVPNGTSQIIIVLGSQSTPITINSKRPLREKEVIEIVNGLNNDRKPRLVKNKTCFVLFEI